MPDRPRDAVDEYLERLDAALTARQSREPASGPASPAGPAAAPSLVAEAFAALLALEEGEPGARPVRLVIGGGDPRLPDAFLDELARRVAERLK